MIKVCIFIGLHDLPAGYCVECYLIFAVMGTFTKRQEYYEGGSESKFTVPINKGKSGLYGGWSNISKLKFAAGSESVCCVQLDRGGSHSC